MHVNAARRMCAAGSLGRGGVAGDTDMYSTVAYSSSTASVDLRFGATEKDTEPEERKREVWSTNCSGWVQAPSSRSRRLPRLLRGDGGVARVDVARPSKAGEIHAAAGVFSLPDLAQVARR